MAESIPQSLAKLVVFRAVLASDGITPATGKTIAITLSKNGATSFSNPAAGATNATEMASGFYKVALGTDDTDTLGPLALRGAEGTILDVGEIFTVEPYTLDAAISSMTTQDSFNSSMAYLAVVLAAMPADVKGQVVEALTVDLYAEPTSFPPATATLERKLGQLYKHLINEHTVTDAADTLKNDDDSPDIVAQLSDDGTTGTRTKWADA